MLIKQCFDSVYHHVSSIWSCCHAMSQDQWRQWSFPYFLTKQPFQLSWNQCAQSVITTMAFSGPQWQCVLHSLCFCKIWTLCVSWITYSHLHYVPYIACWVHWYQQCLTVHQMPKGLIATSPLWWYRETTLFSWLHHGLLIVNFKSRLITHNTVSFFIILNWPNRIDSNWPWWCWSLQILIKRFFIFSTSYYIW